MKFPHLPVSSLPGATQNFEHLQKVLTPKVTNVLPADPEDGQEILWPTPSGKGAFWRFRYWANSPNAQKWMFVGGLAQFNTGPAGEVTVKGNPPEEKAFVGGPSVVIPVSGVWTVNSGAQIIMLNEGLQEGQLMLRKNGVALLVNLLETWSNGFNRMQAMGIPSYQSLAAGDVLTLAGKTQVNAERSVQFISGIISIEPVRVGA